jgi:hypothetical protein
MAAMQVADLQRSRVDEDPLVPHANPTLNPTGIGIAARTKQLAIDGAQCGPNGTGRFCNCWRKCVLQREVGAAALWPAR